MTQQARRDDGPRDVAHRPRLLAIQITVTVLALSTLWGWIIIDVVNSRAHRFEGAANELTNISRALAAFTGKTLEGIQAQLMAFDELYQRIGSSARHDPAVVASFVELARNTSGIRAFALQGADGVTVQSAVLEEDGQYIVPKKNFDASNRPYFRHFADNWNPERAGELHIGSPVKGAVTGQWALPIVRPRVGADGTFAGVVLMTFLIQDFHKIYRTFEFEDLFTIGLARLDGIILARIPFVDSYIGLSISEDSLFTKHIKESPANIFRTIAPTDERDRLVGYHVVSGFPVVVVVSNTITDILRPWWTQVWTLLATGIVASMVLLALMRQVFLRTRDLEAEDQRLRAMVELRTAELHEAIDEVTSGNTALHESEERFRVLVHNNPYGIQEIDTRGYITFTNPAHDKIYGYTDGEMVGKPIWELLDSKTEQDKLRQYLEELVREQPPPTPYFEQDRTKDGRLIDILVHWAYKRDSEGCVIGFISTLSGPSGGMM